MNPRSSIVSMVIASACMLSHDAHAQVVTEFSTGITAGAAPYGITSGPDGNVWFTEQGLDRIGRITPLGVVTEFSAGITAGARPTGITSGPDGNLWFGEVGIDRIGRITTAGVVTEFSTNISPGSGPFEITKGPDGNLWFTEIFGHQIGRITTAGVVSEFGSGVTLGAEMYGITAGPDGNLWFTESNSARVGRITTSGVITEFVITGSHPENIVSGPDGNLWFADYNDAIGRIGTLGNGPTRFTNGISANSAPEGIALGPDGNLWFTEAKIDRIGRIRPLGFVKEFTGITPGAGLQDITVGPDGNLWFTEDSIDRIGRMTIPPPAVVSAASRKIHGAAGEFDLPLSVMTPPAIDHNPITEPRQSPTATIAITFDAVIVSADVAISEGTATAGAPTFSATDVVVPLTGILDQQYVTISLSNVSSALFGGGSGSVRIGFLMGDVNQTRVVTVGDLGLVNAQLAQTTTAANYLKDVNVSGTITLADKALTNFNLTRSLPTP
jgi:streptogramin lyase